MKERTMFDFYPMNLARDVLQGTDLAKVYLPGIGTALYLLSERERVCLTARYERGLTYDELGKEQGVTRERVRQIVMKALQKLKHPTYARLITGISREEHRAILNAALAEKDAIMVEKEKTLIAYYTAVRAANGRPPELSVALQPIENLDLSVRSYTCLRRAGKNTVGDVAAMSEHDLLQIRNLGRRSAAEIVSKLRDLGINIPWGEE